MRYETPTPTDPAFAIGETVDVMTPGVVQEIITTPKGRDYLVRHTKEDGREIYIRTAEANVFEHDDEARV